MLLKDTARLEQERAAFASKRQVYKGFSREQLSNGVVPRTHSADSMEGFSFSGGNSSYNRQQVLLWPSWSKLPCQHAEQMYQQTASNTQASTAQQTVCIAVARMHEVRLCIQGSDTMTLPRLV